MSPWYHKWCLNIWIAVIKYWPCFMHLTSCLRERSRVMCLVDRYIAFLEQPIHSWWKYGMWVILVFWMDFCLLLIFWIFKITCFLTVCPCFAWCNSSFNEWGNILKGFEGYIQVIGKLWFVILWIHGALETRDFFLLNFYNSLLVFRGE